MRRLGRAGGEDLRGCAAKIFIRNWESGIEYWEIEKRVFTGDEAALVSREQVVDVARMLKGEFGFLQMIDALGHGQPPSIQCEFDHGIERNP